MYCNESDRLRDKICLRRCDSMCGILQGISQRELLMASNTFFLWIRQKKTVIGCQSKEEIWSKKC